MTQHGYFLVKFTKKCVNLLLWNMSKETLEEFKVSPKEVIVPYFKDGGKEYLQVDNEYIRIK